MPLNLIGLLSLLLLVWSAILTYLLLTLRSHYNRFTVDTEKKDLLTVLNQLLKQTLRNQKEIEAVNKRLDTEKEKLHFNKFGFKRFNPFTSTGGDQSFVLCLLDENNTGFVISSLHSRENTRVYAKRIVNGLAPDQQLSDEEQTALSSAQK